MSELVIINAWVGHPDVWYSRGQDRLLDSLNSYWKGKVLYWSNVPINDYHKPVYPYTIKAAAFSEAIKQGYRKILWLDCSVWAIQPIDAIVNIIEREGGYFWFSGFNLAQTSNDNDLRWAGKTRDEAELLPEISSSMMGINLETEKGAKWMDKFLSGVEAGVFSSSREHARGSKDKRYMFSRQDQTACSWAYHEAGFTNARHPEVYGSYAKDGKQYADSVCLLMRGM